MPRLRQITANMHRVERRTWSISKFFIHHAEYSKYTTSVNRNAKQYLHFCAFGARIPNVCGEMEHGGDRPARLIDDMRR